jgi:flagellar hook assembly protein FlgD
VQKFASVSTSPAKLRSTFYHNRLINPIHYSLKLARPQNITISTYSILGKQVKELINTTHPPGQYGVIWDGRNNQGKEVASGIYFYQLAARDYKQTQKLVLTK